MSAASLSYRLALAIPCALMFAATQVAAVWAAAGDAPPQSKAPIGELAPASARDANGLAPTIRGTEIQSAEEFKALVKAALRRPISSNAATRSEQVHELVHLYGQLNDASQLSNADRKKLRIQLRSRLLKFSHRLSRDESNHGRATVSKNVAKTSATKSQVSAAGGGAVAASAAGGGPLAASAPGGGAVAASAPGGGAVAASAPGGGAVADSAPGGGAVAASAAELIELIQSTIAPETWDVNGGEGSIVYYAPLQCLVIRQTSEVHHQVGGVVRGLRP